MTDNKNETFDKWWPKVQERYSAGMFNKADHMRCLQEIERLLVENKELEIENAHGAGK